MRKSLYFYSDAPEWGGQEILAARIANILAEKYRVHFFFSTEQFKNALCDAIEKVQLPYHSQGPFPIIRDRLSKKIKIAQKLFLEIGAGSEDFKKLVICPGNIERCIPAIIASRQLKLEVISYYPMAFTQRESQANLGFFRDLLALRVYPKISQWIVNTPYQEKLLRRFIKKNCAVYQLSNPLTFEKIAEPKKPESIRNITTIGRIYFGQKGQEIIPQIANKITGEKPFFTIIGQGPDSEKLTRMVSQKNLQGNFNFVSWASSTGIQEVLQNQTDLLLITSKFESGPMVLFEAIQCGVPVLIANEEYVKDYHLPQWMTYEPGNADDAVKKIRDYPSAWNAEEFISIRQRLFAGRTNEDFEAQVLKIFSAIN